MVDLSIAMLVFGSFHPAKRFEAFRGSMMQHAPKIWHWCRLSILFTSATATIHNRILELQASSHSSRSRSKASRQLHFWISCSCYLVFMLLNGLRWRTPMMRCLLWKRPEVCKLGSLDLPWPSCFLSFDVFCTWNETLLPVWSKLALLIVLVLYKPAVASAVHAFKTLVSQKRTWGVPLGVNDSG